MKVVIVLPPKALESALIDMAKSCCCVVCVVSLRVYQRYPSQKFTHAANHYQLILAQTDAIEH